ncbi:MAG: cation:proton antiporter [Sandaracinaceae bacterium]
MIAAAALIAALVLSYALLSRPLDRFWITAPMVFVGVGLVIGNAAFDMVDLGMDNEPVHLVAELTLVLVLFADASLIDLRALARQASLPTRLLALGMPLSIVLGALVARLLFPELAWLEAFALAAVLAPTDAALGQAVVSSPAVPARIRQTLSVESGLNDGIALPAVLLFTALASIGGGEGRSPGEWLTFGLLQVTLGPLAGMVVGGVGGRLLRAAQGRGWIEASAERVAGLSLAVLAYALAETIGGNGFISAFVAGMAFGAVARAETRCIHDFLEAEGQLLIMLVFLMFGASLLWPALRGATGAVALYVVLSLTVIRMLPVGLSLIGTGVRMPTVLFLGWFGPRGLATVLFGLLVVSEGSMPHGTLVEAVAMCAAGVSVLAHGVTALPFATLYGRAVGDRDGCPEENRDGLATPTRAVPMAEARYAPGSAP